MGWQADGRSQRPRLVALSKDDTLASPAVGVWRGAPAPGSVLGSGAALGELEVLGVLHELVAPEHTHGMVGEQDGARQAERAVGYGDVMLVLRPLEIAGELAAAAKTAAARDDASRLVFRAPLSGRFYARPSPDKPNFVAVGDEITVGQTVALLEVMKTFNRLAYGGEGLPERARVKAVLVRDEADVEAGAPILELEQV
ncbi:MAG TPA: biotin/lipoyl-containing protein [Nannocystaceae bacterium]|nr:biotin/lipoyl-containing protein [Nannocystaceae bacterium]